MSTKLDDDETLARRLQIEEDEKMARRVHGGEGTSEIDSPL